MRHPLYSVHNCLQLLAATVTIGGILPISAPAIAQTQLQCEAPEQMGPIISNYAAYNHTQARSQIRQPYDTDDTQISGFTNQIIGETVKRGNLAILSQGIKDSNGNLLFGLGTIADAVRSELLELGWSQEKANQGSMATVRAFTALPAESIIEEVIAKSKDAIRQSVPNQTIAIDGFDTAFDQALAIALTGMAQPTLESLGLTIAEAETAANAATTVIAAAPENTSFNQIASTAFQEALNTLQNLETQDFASLLTTSQEALEDDLEKIRSGSGSSVQSGDTVHFEFVLANRGNTAIEVSTPTASLIQTSGLTGSASILGITVEGLETTPSSLNIAPQEQMRLIVEVSAGSVSAEGTAVTVNLGNSDCGNSNAQQTLSILPPIEQPLIDPLGRITGCSGELLADYQGFSVGLYEPDPSDPTGTELGEALALTRTEVPDIPSNGIPQGLAPNTENINPFPLSNDVVQEFRGIYNFLFNEATGQLDQGRTYILVVDPPSDSNFAQRRIRIVLGDRNGEMLNYTATSLDGRPIGITDGSMEVSEQIMIDDAAFLGLTLGVMQLAAGVCDAQEVQITKTADRATSQPGDVVIYRLSVRNQSSTTLEKIVLFDQLPVGFNFISKSVRGEISGEEVTITAERNGRTITFRGEDLVPSGEVLNIVYATELTPDSLRGSGENRAIVNAERDDNGLEVKDGPAIHRLRVDPGILSDCGTLIGRVFVDKNFDGEQQPGEPGVPNAVIYLEDGNRITTDADGLFSVANVLPGHHNGTLDLTSLPGYTLAPNHYFSERNSSSRLVRLEPGGMARMNFAVTPTFQELEN